jgi:uncharacterized protein (DUF2236 family)
MRQLLFSPASVFWRVNREFTTGLAGPRAVLMQISHPLVAAGVADHSRFREHRLARLYRTSIAAAAITFGSRRLAVRAVNKINRIHTRVHGMLREDTGRFKAGTPYDANDPELKFWVLATITDSSLAVYERFVAPLTAEERESYYRDSLTVARLFEIPESGIPPAYADFQRYMARMLSDNSIRPGTDAREIVKALFSPSVTGGLLFAGSVVGVGLLPAELRRDLGLHWNPRWDAWLRSAARASSRVRRHTPAFLCSNPLATATSLWMMMGRGEPATAD